MKNTNYAPEIYRANAFIVNHNNDIDLMSFLSEMRERIMPHSDRWSLIYDWMQEHYPESTGSLITGLTYWCED